MKGELQLLQSVDEYLFSIARGEFQYVLPLRRAQIRCRQSVHHFSIARRSQNLPPSRPCAPPVGRAEGAKRLCLRSTPAIHFSRPAESPARLRGENSNCWCAAETQPFCSFGSTN